MTQPVNTLERGAYYRIRGDVVRVLSVDDAQERAIVFLVGLGATRAATIANFEWIPATDLTGGIYARCA